MIVEVHGEKTHSKPVMVILNFFFAGEPYQSDKMGKIVQIYNNFYHLNSITISEIG